MARNVTAVISTYMRPDFLERQLNYVNQNDFDEIIICHVENEHTPEFDFRGYPVVRYSQDPGLHAKFITALSCNTEYVFIYDDDVVPGEDSKEFVLEWMNELKYRGIMTGFGMMVNGDYYDRYWPRSEHPDKPVNVSAAGQCWAMKTEWIRHFWSSAPPVDKFKSGEDLWLSFMCHLNGVDTFVAPHPQGRQHHWIQRENMATGERALHTREPDHKPYRKTLIEEAQKRGWISNE